jgi:transcriptional regulator with XRE-family HTH domain
MTSAFGGELRRWRQVRRLSQLALAVEADVSQRHLSFLETGRSQPSREMAVYLGEVLGLPLRERNALLVSAGFAPAYGHASVDEVEASLVRRMLDQLVSAHPFPAVMIDRGWDVISSNQAAGRLVRPFVAPDSPAVTSPLNVMRLMLHPEGFRRHVENWSEVAGDLVSRMRRDRRAAPTDRRMQDRADEMLAYVESTNDVLSSAPVGPGVPPLVLAVHYRMGDEHLRVFSTITTVGSPLDVTLQELSVELFFPADDESERTLTRLTGS